jgi:ABC-2 type transport system permease protein
MARKTAIFWAIGVCALAVLFGSLFGSVAQLGAGNANMLKVLGVTGAQAYQQQTTEQFFVLACVLLAFFSVLAGLVVLQQAKRDAASGALEALLARTVSRTRAYLVYVLGGALVAMIAYSLGYAALVAMVTGLAGSGLSAGFIAAGYYDYLPAIVAFMALGALLVATAPRAYGLVYVYTSVMFMFAALRNLFNLPVWLLRLAPFGWTYNAPVDPLSAGVAAALIAVALALAAAGLITYRYRDAVR